MKRHRMTKSPEYCHGSTQHHSLNVNIGHRYPEYLPHKNIPKSNILHPRFSTCLRIFALYLVVCRAYNYNPPYLGRLSCNEVNSFNAPTPLSGAKVIINPFRGLTFTFAVGLVKE
mmetsp:Transcript_3998/g.8943  ORF Transcript_3998/g.8943 Transcript_3998/m.8943 type:complete len:115 (-) Transcript_3998:624-968(-)